MYAMDKGLINTDMWVENMMGLLMHHLTVFPHKKQMVMEVRKHTSMHLERVMISYHSSLVRWVLMHLKSSMEADLVGLLNIKTPLYYKENVHLKRCSKHTTFPPSYFIRKVTLFQMHVVFFSHGIIKSKDTKGSDGDELW